MLEQLIAAAKAAHDEVAKELETLTASKGEDYTRHVNDMLRARQKCVLIHMLMESSNLGEQLIDKIEDLFGDITAHFAAHICNLINTTPQELIEDVERLNAIYKRHEPRIDTSAMASQQIIVPGSPSMQ